MRKSIAIALLLSVPLPACTQGNIESAGSKAQAACSTAVRVCTAAGGLLGWETVPVDWSIEGMTKP